MINAASDPVKVELVGSWMDSIVPVAALLISVLSIGLTLWFRYSDRLKLVVNSRGAMLVDSEGHLMEGDDRITVQVTNRSRTASTQVTTLTLQLDGGESLAYLDAWQTDDALPKLLGPGESATRSFSMRRVGMSLNSPGVAAAWLRAKAVCGHREVLGKKDRRLPGSLRGYAREYPL